MTTEFAATEWAVWGTTARLVVTDPAALPAARARIGDYLDVVDRACSRFRDDSELSRLVPRAGAPTPIGPVLADYLDAALTVARDTGGDVDPTVGAALAGLGYDRDFALVAAESGGTATTFVPRVDWTRIALRGRTVTVPPGVRLDLGATAKAVAADRCARMIADELGCGALVSLGGDIATAGPGPDGDWQVLVQDTPTEPPCRVRLPAGAALATSSTLRRRWFRGGRLLHHIVDPRTGASAEPAWRTVSVAADTCLAANAESTVAIVRGRSALAALRRSNLPARLVDREGRVVTVNGWPADGDGSRA
ncbi:FAD:protein FMN transferase [Nocardia sp. NPDC003482]